MNANTRRPTEALKRAPPSPGRASGLRSPSTAVPIQNIEIFCAYSGTIDRIFVQEKRKIAWPRQMSKTVRVTDEQWKRVETAAGNRNQSPNHLLVQLAMEALDRREWPRTELEIQLLRSTLFTAQATARNMIAEGREDEVEQIRRDISRLAPDLSKTSTNEENSGFGQAQPPLREA